MQVTFSNQRPRKETCDRCWVMGDGGHLGCEKSLPTQGDLEGLFYLRFRSASSPFQVRFKSVPINGIYMGITWEVLRISNRDK